MLNTIAVMGRLVADPELRKTPNGISTCTFTIACERNYAKTGTERQTDFFDVVTWRGTAEFVCKYFSKGRLIAIDGSLQTRFYEDKNGNKRKVYEILAGNVNFADYPNNTPSTSNQVQQPLKATQSEHHLNVDTDDDYGKQSSINDYAPPKDNTDYFPNSNIGDNEDLPF